MGLFTPDIYKLKKNNRVKELVKLLDHKQTSVRYSAFTALADKTDLSDEIKARMKSMMYDDPDSWIRSMVTLRFARLGDPSISESLIQIIKEGALNSKLALLRLITDKGPSEDVTAVQVIMIGLEDSKIIVRLQAITAANAVKNKKLIPSLGEMLNEKHYKARLLAAKALYNIGRDESVKYLIQLLADRNTEVHSAARTYLAAINSYHTPKAFNDDTFTLSEEGSDSTEPVYEKTARGIRPEQLNEGLSILYNSCRDRYRGVRIEALKSIAIFKNQSSIEFVEKLLYDRFPEVRIEALITLEKIGGKRALDVIEKKGHDKKKIVRDAKERIIARMKKN